MLELLRGKTPGGRKKAAVDDGFLDIVVWYYSP
jgi:hypothetical protein